MGIENSIRERPKNRFRKFLLDDTADKEAEEFFKERTFILQGINFPDCIFNQGKKITIK